MDEQYKIGDLRLCKACNRAIECAGANWTHLSKNAQPRHIARPREYVNIDADVLSALQESLVAANARIAELERQLAQRTGKVDRVAHPQLDAILQPAKSTAGEQSEWHLYA